MNAGATPLSSSTVHAPLPSTRYDVVIVGAGPAGSALAILLATAGWQVLLVERDRLPRHKVCGEFLSPEAQGTLASLGLVQRIRALAPVQLSGAQVITVSGRTLDLNLPGQAWGISRFALDAALVAAAEERGAHVQTETTVTHLSEANNTHLVQLRHRPHAPTPQEECGAIQQVESRVVVLACGRHGTPALASQSTQQRKSQGTRKPARNSSVGIKCHFANVAMPKQTELYLFAGGYIGINPVENGHANVCALASYDAFARAGRSPRGLIEAATQWNPAFGARLGNATALPETECAVAPVDPGRAASPWDQLPRIGDSAAMIPPLCGDGMAMALRSADLCGQALTGYLHNRYAWGEVGRQYRHLWESEFSQRLRVGRWLESMLLSAPTADLLLQVGAYFPSVANYLVQATRGASA